MLPKLLSFQCLFIVGIWGINDHLIVPISAQSINRETSFFRKSPRLIRAATSFRNPRAIATYFFEIEMPENVGNSWQSVLINQQKNRENIKFFPEKTLAFINNNQEKKIPMEAQLEQAEGKNQLNILFKQAIKPGETVTIAIKAINPLYGGIYQFGVRVYPQGNNPQSLYLGIGRIHFDTPGGRP